MWSTSTGLGDLVACATGHESSVWFAREDQQLKLGPSTIDSLSLTEPLECVASAVVGRQAPIGLDHAQIWSTFDDHFTRLSGP